MLIRLLLLVALIIAFVFTVFEKHWPVTSGILALFVIGFVFELFRLITKTNRDLAKFIDAINYKEYSVNFSSYKLGNAFEDLHESFKKTLNLFKQLRLEKEAHYQYILRLIKNLDVGILAVDHSGKIVLYNEKAESLLQLPNLVEWNRFKEKNPQLYNAFNDKKGENKHVINIDENTELSVRSSHFLIEGQPHFVLVFQNIKSEMEVHEMNAWNQLIKILTHEIMNSITPVSSLSETLLTIENTLDNPNTDVVEGLQTINRRSKSLLKFVDDYRKLAHIPSPNKKTINVSTLVKDLERLHDNRLESLGIHFELIDQSNGLNIEIDESLVHQVFDNLISNSIHALKDKTQPKIEISFKNSTRNKCEITFTDNGKGIAENELGKVFIPFYSTKTSGSGIGLSLARQIIQMHGGKIKAESTVNQYCTFKICL